MKHVLRILSLLMVLSSHAAFAHELRPAYLQLREVEPNTFDVLWKVPARGDNLRLGLYVRLPERCHNLTQPRGFIAGMAYVERWRVTADNGLAGAVVSVDGLSSTLTDVLVRVEFLDGATQMTRLVPSSPSFTVTPSPGTWQIVRTYVALGYEHILLGLDHLLFVFGLLLIVRSRRTLLKTITAFTVAHSITLAIATLGYAHAPLAPLNVAIAMSILFLGPEIVRSWRGETSLTLRYPWVVAFGFGLLHGFGFASGLTTAGMAPSAIPQALLWFNVGVELGQVSFVVVVLAMARAFRVLEMRWPLWIERLPGYAVGMFGAFWTIQRAAMMFAGR
ncbi:MAG TPA: HupE/UreJ family protein [Candidatus Krumholzibacteria bacterium]|nr:HupE/UreJ family protein [Candidatus Krumholzibacteria bacterium]